MVVQPFYGTESRPLLWAASLSARGRVTVNYSVIFMGYTCITSVTRGPINQSFGSQVEYPCTAVGGLCLSLLLTPWSRFLLEKLTGSQLVKKFPAFFFNPNVYYRFYMETSARNLFLFWAISIQPMTLHSTFRRFVLILSSRLCLGLLSCFFPLTLFTPAKKVRSSFWIGGWVGPRSGLLALK
jgi:hypothetical protein